ncbi:unnamed protein product, partial [Symbiodinium sp. KB8]
TSQRRADGNAAPDEYCLVCSAPAGSSALSYARHPSSGVDTAASGSLGSAALAAEQALAAGTARVLCTPTTDATEFMHAVAEVRARSFSTGRRLLGQENHGGSKHGLSGHDSAELPAAANAALAAALRCALRLAALAPPAAAEVRAGRGPPGARFSLGQELWQLPAAAILLLSAAAPPPAAACLADSKPASYPSSSWTPAAGAALGGPGTRLPPEGSAGLRSRLLSPARQPPPALRAALLAAGAPQSLIHAAESRSASRRSALSSSWASQAASGPCAAGAETGGNPPTTAPHRLAGTGSGGGGRGGAATGTPAPAIGGAEGGSGGSGGSGSSGRWDAFDAPAAAWGAAVGAAAEALCRASDEVESVSASGPFRSAAEAAAKTSSSNFAAVQFADAVALATWHGAAASARAGTAAGSAASLSAALAAGGGFGSLDLLAPALATGQPRGAIVAAPSVSLAPPSVRFAAVFLSDGPVPAAVTDAMRSLSDADFGMGGAPTDSTDLAPKDAARRRAAALLHASAGRAELAERLIASLSSAVSGEQQPALPEMPGGLAHWRPLLEAARLAGETAGSATAVDVTRSLRETGMSAPVEAGGAMACGVMVPPQQRSMPALVLGAATAAVGRAASLAAAGAGAVAVDLVAARIRFRY